MQVILGLDHAKWTHDLPIDGPGLDLRFCQVLKVDLHLALGEVESGKTDVCSRVWKDFASRVVSVKALTPLTPF